MRTFLLRNSLLSIALKTLSYKENHVALGGIRFFRIVLGIGDDFYNRHIVQNKLFDPLVDALKRNGTKYNLLNSTLIEVFEYINSTVCITSKLLSPHCLVFFFFLSFLSSS